MRSQNTGQIAADFFDNSAMQREFMEQYWVAQYFGNQLLRELLRICPWNYRQSLDDIQREWRRRHLNRMEYRTVEWIVRRYGIYYQEEINVQRITVTYAQYRKYIRSLPKQVKRTLFSPSLRRHIRDIRWASRARHEPSFIESNCRFHAVWPREKRIPYRVRQFITPTTHVTAWLRPPGYISDSALRLYFSLLGKLTHIQSFCIDGLYETEINFGPYQIFGMSPAQFRERIRHGVEGVYYDAEMDAVWIVDFYFGAVYNYLHRVLHQFL